MPGWYDSSIHAAVVTNNGYTWLSADCEVKPDEWKSSTLLLDTHIRADLPKNTLKASSRWGGLSLHCHDIKLDGFWLTAVGKQSGKRTVLNLNKFISNSGGKLEWDSES